MADRERRKPAVNRRPSWVMRAIFLMNATRTASLVDWKPLNSLLLYFFLVPSASCSEHTVGSGSKVPKRKQKEYVET